MLNKISFLVAFTFFTFTGFTQICELPNGDMEVWSDITAEGGFSDLGVADSAVMLPNGYASLFRPFFIDIVGLFEQLADVEFLNAVENFFGIKRSTDASTGEFAMQLGADASLPLADVIAIFPCNGSLPSQFSLDIKHVGTGIDTLTILGVFGDKSELFEIEDDLSDVSAIFGAELFFDAETDYQKLTIPIDESNPAIAADTFLLFMLLSSNEAHIAEGNTTYVLMDNLKFEGDEVNTSIKEIGLQAEVNVYPTLFETEINIYNKNELLEATISDLSGKIISTFQVPRGQSTQNLQEIQEAGYYTLTLFDKTTNGIKTTTLVKQ